MATPKNYHVGIKALIVQNGKVLALKDARRYRGFDFPGGKIDKGETLERALKRELREELGLKDYEMGKLIRVYERLDYENKDYNLMIICFRVDAPPFQIKLSHEHTSYKWLSQQDVNSLKDTDFRNKDIKKALEKALK